VKIKRILKKGIERDVRRGRGPKSQLRALSPILKERKCQWQGRSEKSVAGTFPKTQGEKMPTTGTYKQRLACCYYYWYFS